MTAGQVGNDLLAHPTPLQQSRVRVREAPLEVWHYARIRTLLPEVVRVLQVNLLIRTACARAEESMSV